MKQHFKPPQMDHTLKELEKEKGIKFLSVGNTNQKIEEVKKEERKEGIEDVDPVSNKPYQGSDHNDSSR